MVTLAEELPFAVVAKDAHLGMVCSSCFASKLDRPISQCTGCRVVSYCNKECQKKDWKDHKHECKYLLNYAPRIPEDMCRLIARIVLKLRRGDEAQKPAFNGRVYADLMDHRDEIRKEYQRSSYVAYLSVVLHDYMGEKFVPDPALLLSIYGKIITNCFGVGIEDGGTGTGLFIGLSVHDHSCAPDAFVTWDGIKAVLRSPNKEMKYSKDLTVRYIDALLWKKDRQCLLSSYYFECTCKLCSDPTRDFMFNSIRSICCPDSYCLLDPDANELNCNKCGAVSDISVKQAVTVNEEAHTFAKMVKEELIANPDTPNGLKYIVEKYETFSKILSPFNLNLIMINDRLILSAFRQNNFTVSYKYGLVHLPAYRKYIPVGDSNLAKYFTQIQVAMFHGSAPSKAILKLMEEAASANEEASLLCKMAKGDLLAEPGTAIHLQSYIELYESFSKVLSPFNLQLLKINDEIVLSAFRLRNHEVGHKYASLHLTAIRRYIPIGDPNHAIRLMKYAITMSRGAEASQQILEAFEEALASSLVSHGPNHRQTTKMEEWVEYNRSSLQSHGIS